MFKFPYDSQTCYLEFGNLAEPDIIVNITAHPELGFYMGFFSNSSEFHVISTRVTRNTWTVNWFVSLDGHIKYHITSEVDFTVGYLKPFIRILETF